MPTFYSNKLQPLVAIMTPCSDFSFVQQRAAQIRCSLSDEFKGSLPTVEEIEAELTREGRWE